jgi:hypothetical protein
VRAERDLLAICFSAVPAGAFTGCVSAQERLSEIPPSCRRCKPRWWKYTDRASAVKGRVDKSASKAGIGTP